MEMILALVVVIAVIIFGALISMGNERQRRALEGIREQIALWASQDLRLKREKLAREVKVDDPVKWLNEVVAKAYGMKLGLIVSEIFDTPQALTCVAEDGNQVVFSPISPDKLWRVKKEEKNRLSQKEIGNPLWSITRKNEKYELSILNAGIFFDLEMSLAWKALTGKEIELTDCLWFYLL